MRLTTKELGPAEDSEEEKSDGREAIHNQREPGHAFPRLLMTRRHVLWYASILIATVPVLLIASAVHLVRSYLSSSPSSSLISYRVSSSPSLPWLMRNTWTMLLIASQPSRPSSPPYASPKNNTSSLATL